MILDVKVSEKRKRQCAKLVELSKAVVKDAFQKFKPEDIGITWTGGKDSGLTLWIIREICIESGISIPRTMIIGEGDEFKEIEAFTNKYADEWEVPLDWCRNENVLEAANFTLGTFVEVESLSKRNQEELKRIGFQEAYLRFESESFEGNHLMKTTVFNQWLAKHDIKAVFQGLRWDEHPSRFNDSYFEEKQEEFLIPPHVRIRPILHFTERDLWDTYAAFGIPFCELYKLGYRSLGAKTTSIRQADVPAWEQDLENTEERSGRHQEKEGVMDQLRALGYM